jgi:two-component system, cell cycle sensor histidine kinase and response regulator CckA
MIDADSTKDSEITLKPSRQSGASSIPGNSGRISFWLSWPASAIGVIFLLAITRMYSYLLFHLIVELFSILIAFTILILVWNLRGLRDNLFLKIIGAGYASAACIDLMHALTFKGMNIIAGYGANLPTQLWIAARYLQAISLLSAPLAARKKLSISIMLPAYAAISLLLVYVSFSGYFPECYIEGVGLTRFKILSEYLIIAIIIASIVLLRRVRSTFTDTTYRLIMASSLSMICAESAFTAYLGVYDLANMVGHMLKLAAYYCLYRALFVAGIRDPFNTLFKELKQSERSLIESRDSVQRQVEERTRELRENEERLRRITDSAHDAVIMIDSRGLITFWNPAAEQILGWCSGEAMGKSLQELIAPEGCRDAYRAAFPEFQRMGRGDVIGKCTELFAKRKDGHEITVDLSLSATLQNDEWHAVGIMRDISERKRAEEELRNALLFNKHIIDSAQDGIIVYDCDLRHKLYNPFMAKLTGLKSSGVLGRTPMELFPYMVENGVVDDLKKTLNGEEVPPRKFQDKIPETGRYGWVVQSNAPLRNAKGDIIGVLSIVRDITDQEKTTEQLHHAQKMEAIGQLAGGVAHDFNNMLTVISGFSNLGLMESEPSSYHSEYFEEIIKASERAAQLTQQLLAFARKQTISPQAIDLNETASAIHNMLQRLIGEGIQLTLHSKADLWRINMDPTQVDQILANLCVNARDAISDTGKIIIEMQNVTVDTNYGENHLDAVPGDYVKLSVSDNGCGMNKETISRIYEPFFTTKEVGKGTGLGLATVFGIVKQNMGFINVYSEPGEGTAFSIYLPRLKETGMQHSAELKEIPLQRGDETILLVEDEPEILKITSMILEKQGYTLLTAETPNEAIRLAQEHEGEINLLVTDVIMPNMNGRDLANKLLSIHPNIKRIFMSGYTADVITHHGVLDEGVSFIQKPFTPTKIAAKVRAVPDN